MVSVLTPLFKVPVKVRTAWVVKFPQPMPETLVTVIPAPRLKSEGCRLEHLTGSLKVTMS